MSRRQCDFQTSSSLVIHCHVWPDPPPLSINDKSRAVYCTHILYPFLQLMLDINCTKNCIVPHTFRSLIVSKKKNQNSIMQIRQQRQNGSTVCVHASHARKSCYTRDDSCRLSQRPETSRNANESARRER